MTVINLPGVTDQAEQPSDVEKYIDDCKTKFNQILLEVLNGKDQEAHHMEAAIFRSLLEMGLLLLKLFFANHNQGDYGKTMETALGTAGRGRKSEKTYFSVFGKLKVIRYLYYVGDETFAPLDIILNLPVRCYSYFLSEMTDLLNIRDAYSEGVSFLKKFFGIQLSVSASETISAESSELYEKHYDLRNTLPKAAEAGEYTAVSFDGKGVPMIKKEAAKITGRQGKGKKKQKKKKAPVGARYDINATPRTAEEVAGNLVYPGVMKMSQTGLTIAIPFLFRKFFMT
ncbi:hypothetical protein [Desulfonema magnum]|uniref:Uncharacterized protein n=1 Tax=Desulfonema magnum TaxID=45655 RepID=A0A975BQR0_9BACT|nr:hypothetical protein [Desulfonema magnum]QTA89962.1 Uncharacterized protein dnm_060210 [Desulfonema magnum]